MKISSAIASQNTMKAYINQPRRQSPDPDTLAKYVMCLDGAWEAWLDTMKEDTLFNMQNWESGDSKK